MSLCGGAWCMACSSIFFIRGSCKKFCHWVWITSVLRFVKNIFITNLQSIPPLLKHIFVTKKDLTTSHLWEEALSCKRWVPDHPLLGCYCKTLSLSSVQNSCRISQWLYGQMDKALERRPTWIKENCVQHLFRIYGSLGNTWVFFIFSLPLLISPSLWLKHVHPGFITY